MFPLLLLLCSEMLSPLLLQHVPAEIGETALDEMSDVKADDGTSSVAIVEIWFIFGLSMLLCFFDAGEPAALPGIWLKWLLR